MLNKKNIAQQEQEWEIEKDLIKRKQKIEQEKADLNKRHKQLTTTKLLMLFLFINCTVIEVFTGWTVIQSIRIAIITGLTPDFSPLVTLIGAVVGEVFGFAIYALKSAKENSANGIVFETVMKEIETKE